MSALDSSATLQAKLKPSRVSAVQGFVQGRREFPQKSDSASSIVLPRDTH